MNNLKTQFLLTGILPVGLAAIVTLLIIYVLPTITVWAIPLVFIACLALAFGLATLFTNQVEAVLEKMNVALAMAANGKKGEAIILSRTDKLGETVDAVNHLMDRDKAVKQANEDPLTGLANRRYLEQRLDQEMKANTPLALIFIDLDGFKPINDEHGHEAGDIALQMVSERLGACVRERDVLCRLGGDEFVIMFVGLSDREVLKTRADKVIELVNQPYWIEGTRIRMGASLGIAIGPDDGETAEEVLNAADEAMYAAKQGGKNAYRFYS